MKSRSPLLTRTRRSSMGTEIVANGGSNQTSKVSGSSPQHQDSLTSWLQRIFGRKKAITPPPTSKETSKSKLRVLHCIFSRSSTSICKGINVNTNIPTPKVGAGLKATFRDFAGPLKDHRQPGTFTRGNVAAKRAVFDRRQRMATIIEQAEHGHDVKSQIGNTWRQDQRGEQHKVTSDRMPDVRERLVPIKPGDSGTSSENAEFRNSQGGGLESISTATKLCATQFATYNRPTL